MEAGKGKGIEEVGCTVAAATAAEAKVQVEAVREVAAEVALGSGAEKTEHW